MYKKNRDGFIDYNDLATQSTPLAYTTGNLQLTNDGAGPYSTSTYAPMGVSTLWNTTTNQFDFSKLAVGDEIALRIDINVTTSTPNQVVKIYVRFDIGGSPYNLTIDQQFFKSAGTYNIVETEKFYIGSTGMKNNPGQVLFNSDANASIVVNGFYISTYRK